jgi:hypothetical protein
MSNTLASGLFLSANEVFARKSIQYIKYRIRDELSNCLLIADLILAVTNDQALHHPSDFRQIKSGPFIQNDNIYSEQTK